MWKYKKLWNVKYANDKKAHKANVTGEMIQGHHIHAHGAKE